MKRGERAVWLQRFWEHTIRDERDYAAHVDDVHFNPVKHGLAESAAAWRFSSFRRAVLDGVYPESWSEPKPEPGEAGER